MRDLDRIDGGTAAEGVAPAGFALMDVLVSMVLGVALVATAGVTTRNLLLQQRVATENAASTSLARSQMELLLGIDASSPSFASGGPVFVDAAGATALHEHTMVWTVTPNDPTPGSARVRVTVTHATGPRATVRLETYRRTS